MYAILKNWQGLWRMRDRGAWRWGAVAALLALLILIPLSTPLFSVVSKPTDSLRSLIDERIPRAIVTTILLCVSTSITTVFFGSTTAWILTRYRFRFERWLELLLMLPLAIPAYIHAYSLPASITHLPPFLVAWYVLTFSLTPYTFIISRFAFQHESRIFFDVAEVHGIRHTFLRVAIPMARPVLIGAALLVSMEVLNEYGTFVYLGVQTITTLLFHLWFGYYDIQGATQLAGYILCAIIILAVCERYSRRGIIYEQKYSALRQHTPRRVKSRAMEILLQLYCLIPISCGIIIPTLSLGYWSTQVDWRIGEMLLAALHSIGIASTAVVICFVVGLLLAYSKHATQLPGVSHLIGWATYGYAVPGGIIAISILRIGGSAISDLFLIALIFAYMVRYLAVCYHPLRGALTQQCARADEVARSLGASRWRRLWRIALPQLNKPMGAVLIMLFFDILKDLPLTLILRPIGLETLALKSFYYASEEQFSAAAPFALLICLIGVIVVITARSRQQRNAKESQ